MKLVQTVRFPTSVWFGWYL